MIKSYIVDSFTNEAFKGNPAGVCLLDQEIDTVRMQCIAKELGLSETAFVKQLDSDDYFSIRYFSPKMEIPLCGHATLASAKVLFKNHGLSQINFETIEKIHLPVTCDEHKISMNFPIYKTIPAQASAKLLSALGIQDYVNVVMNTETKILLIEISDVEILRRLKPDFPALIKSNNEINGVLLTAISADPKFDFESRYFWPWSGTDEDPVTGGTHTFLAKYWGTNLSKTKMMSYQCSARSGILEVELLSDNQVVISGQAVIVFEGNLLI